MILTKIADWIYKSTNIAGLVLIWFIVVFSVSTVVFMWGISHGIVVGLIQVEDPYEYYALGVVMSIVWDTFLVCMFVSEFRTKDER